MACGPQEGPVLDKSRGSGGSVVSNLFQLKTELRRESGWRFLVVIPHPRVK